MQKYWKELRMFSFKKQIVNPIAGQRVMSLAVLPQWQHILATTVFHPNEAIATYCGSSQCANSEINADIKYSAASVGQWQDPEITFKHKTGDCIDIAILKYFLLRDKGNFLVVGELSDGRCHAVLIFLDEDYMVFDSMTNDIVTWSQFKKSFTPAYFFTKDGVWL